MNYLIENKKNICIINSNAGFCHRSTENSIKAILNKYPIFNPISLEICNDIYFQYNPAYIIFKLSMPEIYNKIVLEKSKTRIFWPFMLLTSKIFINIHERTFIKVFNNVLDRFKPVLVISLVPLFNNIFYKSTIHYNIPFLTIMVDLSEFFKSMWFQNKQQLIAVGTEKAFQQAVNFGIPQNKIIRMSGNLILQSFKSYFNADIFNKEKFAKKFKILLIFGGQGLTRLLEYASVIEKSNLDVELLCICGRNKQLLKSLKKLDSKKFKQIFGFVNNISKVLSLVDIVITKPGPCTIFESIEMKKPLLVELNKYTLIQERYNAKWVQDNGFGLIFKDSSTLLNALKELILEHKYWQIKEKLEYYKNNSSLKIENKILELIK